MKKINLRNKKGITLIALVVTIIVLIILAGISISLVLGDNGIITKARDAKEKKGRAELIEKAKIDILDKETDNIGNGIKKEELLTILNKYFEDVNNLEIPDDFSNSDITLKAKSNYGGYKDIKLLEIYDGTINNNKESRSTICFLGKKAEDVNVGDDFTIGIRKTRASNYEKFKVIKKEGTIIKAIPYYNITLTNEEPKQKGTAGVTNFSNEDISIADDGNINMTDEGNEVQKYIDAYKLTLEKLGAKNISTKIPTNDDFSEVTALQRNPSQTGEFWIGSYQAVSGGKRVRFIYADGTFGSENNYKTTYKSTYQRGVRPLIEIDTERIEYLMDENETCNFKSADVEQKLTNLINLEDYGKNIDYIVTIKEKILDNWKIFLNDGNNVYIILGDYLEAKLMPNNSNIGNDLTNYKYNVWSKKRSSGITNLDK